MIASEHFIELKDQLGPTIISKQFRTSVVKIFRIYYEDIAMLKVSKIVKRCSAKLLKVLLNLCFASSSRKFLE